MKQHLALSLTGFVCRCIFVLMALATMAGCTTLPEEVETLTKEGRIDEALRKVEGARASDRDGNLAGLERSVREKWLADKLIEVRLLRLSGKLTESAELMRKILRNETLWEQIPGGAVYSTQAEETEHLSNFVQSAILKAANEGRPLEAEFRFRQERELLETLKVSPKHLKTAIAQSSQKYCQSARKKLSNQDHYEGLFLAKSCTELGVQLPTMKTTNSVQLFGSITPTIQIATAPSEQIDIFQRDLAAEFRRSVWYSENAKQPLPLSIEGLLTERITTRSASRARSYMVRVPYEEKSIQKAQPKSGLGMFFDILAWLLVAEYNPKREVKNFDGTVTVYETKYRDEPRDYNYTVTEVTQVLATDWRVQLGPKGKIREFPFKTTNQVISDEHGISFPDAKLSPSTRQLVRISDWLVGVNRNLIDRITSELQEAWVEQFCMSVSETASRELQHRCLYGTGARIPAVQNAWFLKTYGLELTQWRQFTASSPVLASANK